MGAMEVMKFFGYIMSSFILGCGLTQKSVHREINPYVVLWENEMGVSARVTSISFGDVKDAAGVCNYLTRDIVINRDIWNRSGYFSRKNLIYHELGHCVLYKRHNNDRFPDGCPKSIMLDSMFEDHEIKNCFIPYMNYYLQELGQRKD